MKHGVGRTAWATAALASLGAVLGGCERGGAPGGDAAGIMLTFSEQEHGSEPFFSRTIVTSEFLRMDGGEAVDDFVLFDRRSQTIYSVNALNGDILVVEPRAVKADPGVELTLSEERVDVGEALPPVVSEQEANRHRYSANGQACLDVVTVPGMYEDAAAAMGEFLTVLAGQHGAALAMVPSAMRQPCDLATHIFAPTRHLRHGLPVWERSEDGAVHRYLTAHDPDWEPAAEMFTLPEGYERYSLGGA